MWARIQLAAFLVGMLAGLVTQSPWAAAPFLALAIVLNIPVLKNAKCPTCGAGLIADSASPWRLAPIFKLIAGSHELCAACSARKTNWNSEQENA
jgi:hypothetical protein